MHIRQSTSAQVITNVLSTRDCSPWRPAAVMSMAAHDNHQFPQIFTGRREHTDCHKRCGTLPGM